MVGICHALSVVGLVTPNRTDAVVLPHQPRVEHVGVAVRVKPRKYVVRTTRRTDNRRHSSSMSLANRIAGCRLDIIRTHYMLVNSARWRAAVMRAQVHNIPIVRDESDRG